MNCYGIWAPLDMLLFFFFFLWHEKLLKIKILTIKAFVEVCICIRKQAYSTWKSIFCQTVCSVNFETRCSVCVCFSAVSASQGLFDIYNDTFFFFPLLLVMRKVLWRDFFFLWFYHPTLLSPAFLTQPTVVSIPAPAGTSCFPSLLQTSNFWILLFIPSPLL